MVAGIVLDAEIRRILRRMLETDESLEPQDSRLCSKVDQGDAVSEDIVDPPDLSRCGVDIEPAFEQPLIEAVARPKHHLMQSRPNRLFVIVGGGVMDRKSRHKSIVHSQPPWAWSVPMKLPATMPDSMDRVPLFSAASRATFRNQ